MGRRTIYGPPGARAPYQTAAEAALLRRPDLLMFFDAKLAVQAAGKVAQLASRRAAPDGSEYILSPVNTAIAPALVTTTDGQTGLEIGVGTTGVFNGRMIGGANVLMPNPSGPWRVAIVADQQAGKGGELWATNSGDVQMSLAIQTNGAVVFYKDYSSAIVAFTGANASDGNPHLWEVTHDGAGGVAIYRDGTVIAAAANVVFPVYQELRLRIGAVNNTSGGAGDPADAMEGHIETFIVGGSVSPDLHAAIRAVVAERHPGWAIA